MSKNSKTRRYTNARELAAKQMEGGGASYLKIPKGMKLFKPKVGVMLLDIIPFEAGKGNPNADEGMTHFERSFWVHNNVGVNNDRVICPAKTFNSKCPICELRMKLRNSDEDAEEQVRALGTSWRQLFLVYNRKDPDAGVQLFDVSNFCFGAEINKAINSADEDEGVDAFFLPEGGMSLKVMFDEESFSGTKFMKAQRVDFKPRKEDLDEDIVGQAVCLDEVIAPMEYKDIKKMVLAIEDEEDEEDEEEDDDAPRSAKSKSKAKAKDDDDEEEDEEDEDEDEKPAKSKKKSSKDDDDEEDEEDDEPKSKKKAPKKGADWNDFDEDDEEEKPKAKSKSKDDDEEEEDEDDEDEKPKGKKKKAPSWGEDDDEEDEEDEPKSKKQKNRFADDEDEDEEKPRVKSRKAKDEDEDEDDD